MTPDEYMDVLLKRQAEHKTTNPGAYIPLLEWFVRDTDRVNLPETQPKRTPQSRRYIPAADLRTQRDALTTKRDRINPGLPDRAAAGGVGIGRERAARHNAAMDNALITYTDLTTRIQRLNGRITQAERREAP